MKLNIIIVICLLLAISIDAERVVAFSKGKLARALREEQVADGPSMVALPQMMPPPTYPLNPYATVPASYTMKPTILDNKNPNNQNLAKNQVPQPPKKLISPVMLGPQKRGVESIPLRTNPTLPVPPLKYFQPSYVESVDELKADESDDIDEHTTKPARNHA